MNNRISIPKIINSPWFIALLLTTCFFLSTGYKFGWDDQHLEIPLLKHLIDDSLYAGDYYVESLTKNFSSFFYPILSKIITVGQIPQTYFFLYIISRYFLFFWAYKLWLHLSQCRFKAFSCVMVFILMARVHEFLYRTFSHQEFALAFIFAGIYFFFKNRFYLAAIILGLAANIHALYSLFPMIFISMYLIWQMREHGFRTFFVSGLLFCLFSSPFVFVTVQTRFMTEGYHDPLLYMHWISLYIKACPQNFIFPQYPQIPLEHLFGKFKTFYALTDSYFYLIALFVFNITFNKTFRTNKKALTFCIGAFALLVLCLVFTYIYPNRFVLDLNLVRNTQFMLFLLMGFTTIFIITKIKKEGPLISLIFALAFVFLKYSESIASSAICVIFLVLCIEKCNAWKKSKWKFPIKMITIAAILPFLYFIWHGFDTIHYRYLVRLNVLILFCLLIFLYFLDSFSIKKIAWFKTKHLFILIPISIFLFQYTHYRNAQTKLEAAGRGWWGMQNSWVDMQYFVQENTPTDAVILVPYNMEMGGFRMFSEREIVVSYRDCGIVGFDYPAAKEWEQRISDVEAFKYNIGSPPINAIRNAVTKYKANYIVFMRYASPNAESDVLRKVYTNTHYVLFEVYGDF